MARKTKGEGRQLLIDAALHCIVEHGYHRSSVRKIAETAGVTAGLLRYYFDGKSELMFEAYRHFMRQYLMADFYDALQAGPDPNKRLEAYIRATFSYDTKRPNKMKLWIGFMEFVLTEPDGLSERFTMYDFYVQEVSKCIIGIYAGRGEKVTPEQVRNIAIGIKSLMNGLWLEHNNPSLRSHDDLVAIALDFIGARLAVRFSNDD